MTYSNSTTTRLEGQHLTAIERGKIAAWHSEGISNRQIAKRLGVVPQTINNELKRGKLKQVKKINGNVIISSSIMQNLLKIGIETTDNDAIGKKNFFKSVPFWRTLSNCLKQRAILQM